MILVGPVSLRGISLGCLSFYRLYTSCSFRLMLRLSELIMEYVQDQARSSHLAVFGAVPRISPIKTARRVRLLSAWRSRIRYHSRKAAHFKRLKRRFDKHQTEETERMKKTPPRIYFWAGSTTCVVVSAGAVATGMGFVSNTTTLIFLAQTPIICTQVCFLLDCILLFSV